MNFIYLKSRGLYFLLTSLANVSPSLSFEVLNRITKLIKDYCGILSEDSIRTNFVLIYEILDEVMVWKKKRKQKKSIKKKKKQDNSLLILFFLLFFYFFILGCGVCSRNVY